jgi:hypothetical protein
MDALMSRRAARITQADVARALRAAEQVAPGRRIVEVTPEGVIRIVPLDANQAPRAARPAHESEAPFACGLETVP